MSHRTERAPAGAAPYLSCHLWYEIMTRCDAAAEQASVACVSVAARDGYRHGRVDWLLQRHAGCALSAAAIDGDLRSVRALLALPGADPNGSWTEKDPPLVVASRHGRLDVVRALLAAGARVAGAALHEAAEGGHTHVVAALCEAGADPDAPAGLYNWTPLMQACDADDPSMADALLRAGADPDTAYAPSGLTALAVAARRGGVRCVELLLRAGARPNPPNTNHVPLSWAARNGHAGAVAALLRAGADASFSCTAGKTAGGLAAEAGHEGVLRALRLHAAGGGPKAAAVPGRTRQ